MKKTFKFFMCAAIAAAGFTACSEEVDRPDGGSDDSAEMGVLQVTFTNGPETYADVAATTAEKTVYNVLVSIVHQNGSIKDTVLNASNLTVNEIPLKSGSVTVYAGINLGNGTSGGPTTSNYYTAALPAASRKVLDLRPASALSTTIDTFNLTAPMYSASTGFHMFSSATSGVQAQIVADDVTTISLDVKRLVAKVNVKTSLTADVVKDGVTFKVNTLQFAMGQVNMSTYYLPKPGNHDPNYETPMSSGKPNIVGNTAFTSNFANEFITKSTASAWNVANFKPIATSFSDDNAKYVLENTSDVPAVGAATYACVKVQFEPPYTVTYTAGSLVEPTQVTWSAPNPNRLYVVRNSSKVYFFKDKDEATAFRDEVFDVVPSGTAHNVDVEEFRDLTCFYWVFPENPAYGAKQVIRNDYYQLNVSEINSLGYPQGEIDDKGNQIDGDGKLTVNINIVEWNGIEKDVPLER